MAAVNFTPTTYTAGMVVTDTELTKDITTAWTNLQSSWDTYSPSHSGITLGTGGTLTARYQRVGKTIDVFIQFTFGTGSSMGTSPTINLPVNALESDWVCPGRAFDASASNYYNVSGLGNATQIGVRTEPTVAGGAMTTVTATSPFTWASGDTLTLCGRYEAA